MKVIWSEGMFLSPHHLQQWDRENQQESWGAIQTAASGRWGIAAMGLDLAELAGGQVVLRELRAVLPDGTLLDLARDPEPPPRAIPVQDISRPLGIYIALPALRSRDSNVQMASDPRAALARYRVEEIEVYDTISQSRTRQIEIGHLNIRLLFDGESTEGWVRMKLAEVTRDVAGRWQLNASYVPNCLRLDASPVLRRLLEDLLARMAARRKALQERQLKGGAMELTASDVMLYWFLHTLNGAVARLDHDHKIGSLAPERVFADLRACAGQLCTFTDNRDPLALPSFQQDDLYGCFSALILAITQLLEAVVPVTYVTIPLKERMTGLWDGDLPEDRSLDRARFFLLLGGALPQGNSVEGIGRALKLAARDDLEFILSASLRGVDLVPLPRPPSGAPRRRDTIYLRLRTRGQFWDTIQKSRQLSLHLPGSLASLSLELIAIP